MKLRLKFFHLLSKSENIIITNFYWRSHAMITTAATALGRPHKIFDLVHQYQRMVRKIDLRFILHLLKYFQCSIKILFLLDKHVNSQKIYFEKKLSRHHFYLLPFYSGHLETKLLVQQATCKYPCVRTTLHLCVGFPQITQMK